MKYNTTIFCIDKFVFFYMMIELNAKIWKVIFDLPKYKGSVIENFNIKVEIKNIPLDYQIGGYNLWLDKY